MSERHIKSRAIENELFVATWLKHGCNATKAYLELHPGVSYSSARALGSRQLTKVNIPELMVEHGLGVETYLKLFKEGLDATNTFGIGPDGKAIKIPDNPVREKYHRRLGKLLGIEQ